MESSRLLASTARAASYNMVLQVMIRLMTFVFNAIILRYIAQDLLGVVNVRLTLLYSTILFLTKEAFERACLSRREGHQDWRHVINLIWCTVPLGVVIGVLLSALWLHVLEGPDVAVVGNYGVGVAAFAVSAFVEVLAEPLYVTGQAFLFIRLKVLGLGLSQAVKCSTALLLILLFPGWGIYSFALAQVLSSLSYVALYWGYFAHYTSSSGRARKEKKEEDDSGGNDVFPCVSMADFLPRAVPGEPFFDTHLVHLTWSFFKQSLLKQILTEGERYVMTFLNVLSFADQGVYDVISNLGSMVARFIFYPIEENAYIFFSQSLSRGKPAKEQTESAMTLVSNVLSLLLKIVALIGCIVVVFGYANSYLALHIYGGDMLSTGTGPSLLKWYCVYVLGCAVNGVTEGFVFATMSKEQVDRYNQKMLVFSVLFLTMAWLLTAHIGSVGFILANCFNMSLRITHSLVFIRRYFEGTQYSPLSRVVPSPAVLVGLGLSLTLTALSESSLLTQGPSLASSLLHIAVSAICLMLVTAAIFLTEKPMVQSVRSMVAQQRSTPTPTPKEHAQ